MDISTMIQVPSIETMHKSKYTVAPSPVYVSDRMTGKMEGIPCISTTMQLNPICKERAKVEGSICAACYAARTTKQYKTLEAHLEENYLLLTEHIIPDDLLPRFKRTVRVVRFESFGDLATVKQAINYINIARVNPEVRFALWTKNPHILAEAIREVTAPYNLTIIYSSPMVNEDARGMVARYPFIDKVFTVYDKEHIGKAEGFMCAGKDCATCLHCYLDGGWRVKEALK